MGLDGVELVCHTEEEFGIALPSATLEGVRTVADFVDVVYGHLRPRPDAPLPAQRGFHLVRRATMAVCRVPRSAVKPDAKLRDLLPKEGRREAWSDLGRALDVAASDWPSLAAVPRRGPKRRRLPVVSDLIPFVASLDDEVWSRSEVEESIVTMIAEQFGLDPEDIRPETRLVEELGLW